MGKIMLHNVSMTCDAAFCLGDYGETVTTWPQHHREAIATWPRDDREALTTVRHPDVYGYLQSARGELRKGMIAALWFAMLSSLRWLADAA